MHLHIYTPLATKKKRNLIFSPHFFSFYSSMTTWMRALHKMILSFNIGKKWIRIRWHECEHSSRVTDTMASLYFEVEWTSVGLNSSSEDPSNWILFPLLRFTSHFKCVWILQSARSAFVVAWDDVMLWSFDLIRPPCCQFHRECRCWIRSWIVLSCLVYILHFALFTIIIKILYVGKLSCRHAKRHQTRY